MGKGHDARYLVSEDVGVHNVDHLLVDTGQVGTHPLHQPLLPWEQRDGAKDAAVLGSVGTGSPRGTGMGRVLRGLGNMQVLRVLSILWILSVLGVLGAKGPRGQMGES